MLLLAQAIKGLIPCAQAHITTAWRVQSTSPKWCNMPQLIRLGELISGGGAAPIAATPQPTFANVVFLAPFDGIDAATPTPELSGGAHVLTYTNGSFVHTGEKKFGTASLLMDGSELNEGVTAPDHADWSFGSGEFTIEAWVRVHLPVNDRNTIASHWGAGAERSFLFEVQTTGNTIEFSYSVDGTAIVTIAGSFTFADDIWYHVAVDRDASDNIRLYVDGAVIAGPTAAAVTFKAAASLLGIGQLVIASSVDFTGRLDDVRIVKGEAVYGGAFNVPKAAHPTS